MYVRAEFVCADATVGRSRSKANSAERHSEWLANWIGIRTDVNIEWDDAAREFYFTNFAHNMGGA